VDYNEELYPASRIVLSSGSEHWCTSPEDLAIIKRFDIIGFDPFSNQYSLVGALRSVCLPENSLLMEWPQDVLTFCNPPYGAALRACAQKIGQHGRSGGEVLTLVPARTDTEWWQDLLRPPVWLAWSGRLTFLEPLTSLQARYQERCEKARKAGQRPPPEPQYKMVGEHLARGETATFSAALCYHGPRIDRFCEIFEPHGRLYFERRNGIYVPNTPQLIDR